MLKRHGRNISIPFFVDLWLRNKFDGTEGFSKYVFNLIINDLLEDKEFVKEFNTELKQIGVVTV